jgi:hypothetical protein
MSKISDYEANFLESIGRDLGYDSDNLPEFKDIEIVIAYHIPVWDYNGMTKEEYYK